MFRKFASALVVMAASAGIMTITTPAAFANPEDCNTGEICLYHQPPSYDRPYRYTTAGNEHNYSDIHFVNFLGTSTFWDVNNRVKYAKNNGVYNPGLDDVEIYEHYNYKGETRAWVPRGTERYVEFFGNNDTRGASSHVWK